MLNHDRPKKKLKNPFKGQVVRKVFNWGDSSADGDIEEKRPEAAKLKDADIVTSEVKNTSRHKIVIDVDFPVVVTNSTTPGHHHLFIDKDMSWDEYVRVLEVLVDVGVVERGYLGASLERGFTGVRLPWVKKPQAEVADA